MKVIAWRLAGSGWNAEYSYTRWHVANGTDRTACGLRIVTKDVATEDWPDRGFLAEWQACSNCKRHIRRMMRRESMP